jgi:hypothetical protein
VVRKCFYSGNLSKCLVENPSPDSYRLKSAFDVDPEASFSKSKAFTFGVSRQAYEKVYMPT